MGDTAAPERDQARGGLAPWQVRKVTSYVDAHLERTIRNEELAALARLNPSHFGRAFRCSFGEPPHEYVIRRRVERAQGLMLSTNASLSAIALDCGLADQAHLSRLFRRVVGETPRAWRRARLGEPAEAI
jgi:transcriptional regulator GlxA family with amidase domain